MVTMKVQICVVFITLLEMVGRKENNMRLNHQLFQPVVVYTHGSVGLVNQGLLNVKPKILMKVPTVCLSVTELSEIPAIQGLFDRNAHATTILFYLDACVFYC